MFSLITRSSPNVVPATLISGILDLRAIIQDTINPLILEIKELKKEIK
jgi:hypothetical protein